MEDGSADIRVFETVVLSRCRRLPISIADSADYHVGLGSLHLLKTVAGAGLEKFRIERHRPIRLAMRCCTEITRTG